jgi:hypothetical protein
VILPNRNRASKTLQRLEPAGQFDARLCRTQTKAFQEADIQVNVSFREADLSSSDAKRHSWTPMSSNQNNGML